MGWYRKSDKGFTLVEAIITVALTAVLMLALANLFINFSSLYVHQQTFVATANAASGGIAALNAAILPASRVLGTHVFSDLTLTTGSDALILELPSVDGSGDTIPGAYDYIGFYLSGTDLYRRIDAHAASVRQSSTKRVAALVDSVAFSYDTADATQATRVSVDISTRLATKSGIVETSLHRQFFLRNK